MRPIHTEPPPFEPDELSSRPSSRSRQTPDAHALVPRRWPEARLPADICVHRLHAVACRVLRSDDLAWDMVQEALILLWQRPAAPADVASWLRRTVLHLSLRQHRTIARRSYHEDGAAELRPECTSDRDPALLSEDGELHERFERALGTLPEEYRMVLLQRDVGGSSYAAIAASLGVPVGTVRSRLSRARDSLRDRLRHLLDEECSCEVSRRSRAGGPPRERRREAARPQGALRVGGVGLFLAALTAGCPRAEAAPLAPPQATEVAAAEPAAVDVRSIQRSTYQRLAFDKDLRRVAVGDTDVLASEPINDREILVLGKEIGRTSLIAWFVDGTITEYLFLVERDVSLLQNALREVDPEIRVEVAPDRDAVVLLGVVSDLATSRLAESVAQAYLDARRGRAAASAPGVLSTMPAADAEDALSPALEERLRAPGTVTSTGRVINLLRVAQLPLRPEEHLRRALAELGYGDVRVQRILRGPLPDDEQDILLLEGSVADQAALVRVLSLAARLFLGEGADADIRVVADEGGALTDVSFAQQGQQGQQGQQQNTTQGLGGITFGLRAGLGITNRVRSNVGRAKVIEAASGRILSFLEVRDLPQVRIDIRLCEIDRTRLESFETQLAVLGSDFRQPALLPAGPGVAIQGDNAANVGSFSGTDVQEAIGFLSGSFTQQVQVSGRHFALDSALSVLESRGIARTLSQPSLSVLSGEQAIFQVGGEVPIQVTQSFANTAVVQVTTEFREFGIQLSVRPLVGEDGAITLDVTPQIVNPDPELTRVIGEATGTNPTTVAFDSRSLRTSARLRDGQVMVIGGLLTRRTADRVSRTPVLSSIPLLGDLFRSFGNQDDQTELVILVNPTIVREEPRQLAAWIFPEPPDVLRAHERPDEEPARDETTDERSAL